MSRPNLAILALILLSFTALLGASYIAKGGLYTATHEGDLFHHLDIVFRMAKGEVIHTDFMTPLGIFSVWPHAFFIAQGMSAGMAFIYAQIMVTLILFPAILWAAWTRFPGWTAYVFGIVAISVAMALVHGGASVGLSVSMHYNRWSWTIAFTALAIALLPSLRAPRPVIDGLLVGGLMAALALTKLTFFLGLAPAVTLAILWPFNLSRFLAALAGGLAVAAYVSVVYGLGFLPAYLGDLLSVAGGDIRKFPGEPIEELIGGSRWIGGSLAAVALLFVLNRVGQSRLAVLLILLLPAFIYITWQNYGNDPIWLVFLALLGFAARPAFGETEAPGGDGRMVLTVVSAVILALTFPSLFHLMTSPLRHYTMPEAKYEPVLPNLEGHQDWLITTDRARTMDATLWLDREGSVWAPQAEAVGREERPSIGDTVFPYCEFNAGTVAWFQEITKDLIEAGVPEGSQFLTIDIVSALWLAGPFEPLEDGAPWYYGELNGIENAEYVLVPRCTFVESARTQMIEDVNNSGVPLELVRENELYWLFATPQAPQVAIAR